MRPALFAVYVTTSSSKSSYDVFSADPPGEWRQIQNIHDIQNGNKLSPMHLSWRAIARSCIRAKMEDGERLRDREGQEEETRVPLLVSYSPCSPLQYKTRRVYHLRAVRERSHIQVETSTSRWKVLAHRLDNFLNIPTTSEAAKYFQIFIVLLIILSAIVYILETLPEYYDPGKPINQNPFWVRCRNTTTNPNRPLASTDPPPVPPRSAPFSRVLRSMYIGLPYSRTLFIFFADH